MPALTKIVFFHQGNDGSNPVSRYSMYNQPTFNQALLTGILALCSFVSPLKPAQANGLHFNNTFSQFGTRVLSPIINNGRKDSFDKYIQDTSNKSDYADLSLTHEQQSSRINIKTHFNASYLDKTIQAADSQQAMKVNKLYLDASIPKYFLSARLGRQSFKMAGTPHPIDGIALSYKLFELQKINFLAGHPQADEDTVDINTEKSLYGISTESERFAKYWKTDAYAYEQTIYGVTDIKVMGARLNYNHNKHLATLQMDMDSDNRETVSSHFAYKWTPSSRHYINLSLDYRKPRAAMGQKLTALDELINTMSAEQTQTLKDDESAAYRSGSLAWGRAIFDRLNLKSEISVSSLSHSLTNDAIKKESFYFYNLELGAENLFKKGDENSLSLRYLDHNMTQQVAVGYLNRQPIKPYWQTHFLLEAYWQNNDGTSQALKFNPVFKLQYNKKDHKKFNLELGMVHYNYLTQPTTTENNDFFLSLSYSGKL